MIVTDWFGVSISPEVTPLSLYPVPEMVTPEIVTFEFPVLVSVVVNELLLPTLTFPKLKLGELSPRTRVAAAPVPLREIVVGELGALLSSVIDPVTVPAALGPNTALNVVALPAAMVTGAVIPVVLKPAPETVTEEIVTVALPPFVRVTVCELLVPVVTLPNAAVLGVAANCASMPVPLKVIVAGEPGALSVRVMLPIAAPVAVGANCALKDRLSPPVNVFGRDSPLIPKPVPATVARLMVTLEFPLFVSFTLCVPLCPTITFPNVKADGAIVKPACVPVPVIEIASGELEASLRIVRLPFIAPADVGANCSCIVLLWPTPMIPEGFPPTTVKPAPVKAAEAIVTVPNPVLVTVKLCVAVAPTAMLPKLTLVMLGESTPAPGLDDCVFAELV